MYVEVGRLNLMTHLKYDRVIIMLSIAGTNAKQNMYSFGKLFKFISI